MLSIYKNRDFWTDRSRDELSRHDLGNGQPITRYRRERPRYDYADNSGIRMSGSRGAAARTLTEALAWGLDPPESFENILLMLRELYRSGRLPAIGSQ